MSTETAAPNKRHFDSVEEIKAANEESGFFFFSPDTMRFFESRTEPEVYGPRGRLFIISDKAGFEDDTREFKIKWVDGDGSIESVEVETENMVYGEWESKAEAVEILRGNLRPCVEDTSRIEVAFRPYNSDLREEDADPESYNWRLKIGNLIIGVRTTRADVERMIEEGFKP